MVLRSGSPEFESGSSICQLCVLRQVTKFLACNVGPVPPVQVVVGFEIPCRKGRGACLPWAPSTHDLPSLGGPFPPGPQPATRSAIVAGRRLEILLFVSVPFFPVSHCELNEGRDPV